MKALRDNVTMAHVSFCAFVSDDFEAFLLRFLHGQRMIHMLYSSMIKLLNIFVKFIKRSALFIIESVCSNKDLLDINP